MCEPNVPENSVDWRPGPPSIAGLKSSKYRRVTLVVTSSG
jgi:hypothetical protein